MSGMSPRDVKVEAPELRLDPEKAVVSLDWKQIFGGGGPVESEIGIGKYFEKHPEARGKVFLVTKSGASSSRGMTKHLNRSLERMKTDYIDLFFMHGISSIREADDEMKAWAEKAKSAGKVRFSLWEPPIPVTENPFTGGGGERVG